MAGSEQRYTPEQVIAALEAHQGLVFLAAEALGCTAATIYNYAKRYASVKNALQEQKGKRIDRVELALWNRINKGDTTAMIFYLKTQAKDRGYVERQEFSGPNGGAIETKTRIIEVVKDYDKSSERPR